MRTAVVNDFLSHSRARCVALATLATKYTPMGKNGFLKMTNAPRVFVR